MFLDLDDARPDTPRVPQAISLREGVLMSMLAHAVAFIGYLLAPPAAAVPSAEDRVPVLRDDAVRYVDIRPAIERLAPPRVTTEHSDLDRRAATPNRAPDPANTLPFARGDTPDRAVTAREERLAGPDATAAPPAPAPSPAQGLVDLASRLTPPPAAPSPSAGGNLGSSLRNLTRYLDQRFDNQQGGLADQGPDIQFDSKGIDFGPWLRRFVTQVKRNWLVPQSAMLLPGRVVIQFYVLRNGTMVEFNVVSPSPIDAYNVSALNALKRSNPTLPLPDDYPDDRAFFTVTFHYDVRLGP